MPGDLDLSRAICRVCGEQTLLTGEVEGELSTFSQRHSLHSAFRIEVVVAARDELPDVDEIPRQRA